MIVMIARFCIRFISITLSVVAVALLSAFAFLATSYGRDTLVRIANEELYKTLSIGSATGGIFSDLTLVDVRIYDPEGEWLAFDRIRIVWLPSALLTKTPFIHRVEADRTHIARLPAYADEQQTDPPAPDDGFPIGSITHYIPRTVLFRTITLEQGILPQRKAVTLSLQTHDDTHHVTIETIEGSHTSLRAVIKPDINDLTVDLLFHEDEGGIIAGILKFPKAAQADAAIRMTTDAAHTITIHQADMHLGDTKITLNGTANFDRGDISINGTAVTALHEWKDVFAIPLDGKAEALFEAKGALKALQTHATIASDSARFDDITLHAALFSTQGMVDLSDLNDIAFDLAGTGSGDLVHDDTYKIEGAYALKGTRADFTFDTDINAVGKNQSAHLKADGGARPADRVFAVTADADATHGKNAFHAHLKASVDKDTLRADALSVEGAGIDIRASGIWEGGFLTGQTALRVTDLAPLATAMHQPVKGSMDADLDFKTIDGNQTADIALRALNVTYQNHRIQSKRPFTAAYQDKKLNVSPFELHLLGGIITGHGHAMNNDMDALFTLRAVRLDPLLSDYNAKARLDGTIRLTGAPDSPIVTTDLKAAGTYSTTPLQTALKATWQENDLKATVQASSNKARINGQAALTAGLSIFPFETDLSADTPINARASLDFPLTALNPLLWETRQNIEGKLSGDTTITGRIGEPHIAGNFRVRQGFYRHTPSGICLENIEATVRATPQAVTLTSLTAKNNGGGTLMGRGTLNPSREGSLNGTLLFKDLKLFCGGLAEGFIDGSLKANGTFASHAIDGKLKLSPLNIQLPGAQNSVNIPHVETVRMRRRRPQKNDTTIVTRLNIAVDAPNQVFIRGRGLDAEFGGHLTVHGVATAPEIEGQFQSRRGKFTFFDRNLKLNKAVLRFQGAMPPSPFLDVNASTTAQNAKVGITLTGSAVKPAIALSSEPTLPQDEILSLLLFGRELNRISPFQALRLARAARSLSGQDGGEPGILDQARSTLGLDALDVGTDDQNNVTVSTGKYITDKVFVGVQQGAKPEDKKLKTEIELRPSISANTTVDAQGNQGVGIGWRYDY